MRDSVLIIFYEAPDVFAKQHLAIMKKRNGFVDNQATNVNLQFAN